MTRRGRLTLEDLARRPEIGMDAPGSGVVAPDGRSLTYLWSADGSLVRSLWRHDLASGERSVIAEPMPETTREETLPREDRLRRERTRTTALGVTSFAWATAAREPTLLVPMAGRLFVSWGAESEHRVRELAGVEHASAPLLSPDGSFVSYTTDGELHLVPVRGGAPRRLTDDADDGAFNGLAEFVAAEELDRFDGAWWSADSRSLAFAHVDERDVPLITVTHEAGHEPAEERHHYPFAGAVNAHVSLRIAPVWGSRTREVALGMARDDYLARVVAHPDGGWLVAVLRRDQRSLHWHRVGADGSAASLWVEHGDPWINLDDDTRVLPDGRILRSTERSGFRHLELRDADGGLDRVLTAGEWVVTGVAAVSATRREVLFTATRDGVLERHLYAVPLDAAEPTLEPARLTVEPAWHAIAARPDGETWIDTWSDLQHSPRLTVVSRDGESRLVHPSSATASGAGLAAPELLELLAADGRTPLQAALYRPHDRDATDDPPPAVTWVYGGPGSQYVKDAWEMTAHPLRQYLAQAGAAVVVVDNRGTNNRGLAFEAPIAGRLGRNEVADQAAALRHLAARGELDAGRVGIVGGSYGGFMAILAMALEPELFRVAVAVAPVTEWTGYDTAYAERYLGTPVENPEAYRASSALNDAAAARGNLLLLHGTVDENVHLRHSTRLVDARRAVGREVRLVTFSEQRHRMRGAAIRERERLTAAHLLGGLGLAVPDELA